MMCYLTRGENNGLIQNSNHDRKKIDHLEKDKSSLECEKLDPREEIKLAEEGFALEKDQWPEY